MNLNPKPSNQFQLKGNIFANATAVNHRVGAQAVRDDCPLRQNSYSFFVGQRL